MSKSQKGSGRKSRYP